MMKKLTALLLALICLFTCAAALADRNAGLIAEGFAMGLIDSDDNLTYSTTEVSDELMGCIVVDFDGNQLTLFGVNDTYWLSFTKMDNFYKCAQAIVTTLRKPDYANCTVELYMRHNEEFTLIPENSYLAFYELLVELRAL